MGTTLTEHQSKLLLAARGLPVPPGREVASAEEAIVAAREIGFPVVCKISRAGLVHKTEAGGVILGVRDVGALDAAVRELQRRGGPGAQVLVEAQIEPGVEMIAGLRRDPVFGPVVMIGLGGIFAEVLRDTAVRLCPVTSQTACEMIGELRGYPLLAGARGRPPADVLGLAEILAGLSRWPLDEPDLHEVDLNPIVVGERGAVVVDATIALAEPPLLSARLLEPGVATFFEARSVAVVGASPNPLKGGNVILQNLQRFGFPGRVVPIHPSAESILGFAAYPSLEAVPGGVDLAIVVVPKESLAEVLADAARSRTRHLIVSTAGFADIGLEGRAEQAALLSRAAQAGIRILGPNSIGVVNAHTGLVTSITTLAPLSPGRISLLGQTGTFASGYANWFASRQRPAVGKIACLGNKGDVDEVDLLDYFAADPETEILGMYTEGFGRAGALDALRRLRGRKPVVVLRAGRTETGRAAVSSHTGSLVGDAAVYAAAFREAGVLVADDLDDFFLTLEALDLLPWPRGPRVAVVSITGIGCVLSADAAGLHGIDLPQPTAETLARVRRWIPPWAPARNPYDIWSAIEKHGPEAAYRGVSGAAIEDPQIDALLLIFVLIEESRFDVGALVRDLRARAPQKPLIAAILGGAVEALGEWTAALEGSGALVAPTPAAALQVLARMAAWAR
jgi:acyl-CoA synthetase (NDP forming)